MTRLRILAGPSLTDLTLLEPNTDISVDVRSDGFEGQIAAYVKGLPDHTGEPGHSPYFDHKLRQGITWSIQVQGKHSNRPFSGGWLTLCTGRFLQTHSADDILFGNIFDRSLKLPWGFGAALRFMKCVPLLAHVARQILTLCHLRYVDPTLEENLQSRTRPWAFSPFFATMPHIHHTRIEHAHEAPPFPASTEPIADEMSRIRTRTGKGVRPGIPNRQRKLRKAHFRLEEKRKEVILGPQVSLVIYDFLSAVV